MSHVAVENALSLDQQVRDGPRERAGGWVGEGRSVNRDMGGGGNSGVEAAACVRCEGPCCGGRPTRPTRGWLRDPRRLRRDFVLLLSPSPPAPLPPRDFSGALPSPHPARRVCGVFGCCAVPVVRPFFPAESRGEGAGGGGRQQQQHQHRAGGATSPRAPAASSWPRSAPGFCVPGKRRW